MLSRRRRRRNRRIVLGLTAMLIVTAVFAGFWFMQGQKERQQRKTLEQKIGRLEETIEELKAEAEAQPESESQEASEPPEAETPVQEPIQNVPETETPSEAESSQAEALEDGDVLKVVLDPGHQGSHVDMSALEPLGPGSQEMVAKSVQGSVGAYTQAAECDLTLNIAKQLRTELESRGYEVVLTREDNGTAISGKERADLVAVNQADIYVGLHANSHDDEYVRGAEALIVSAENPYAAGIHETSWDLGQNILDAYCYETGMQNSGLKLRDDKTELNWNTVAAAILEMGYLTNHDDDTSMQNAEFQQKMIVGIANGIDHYFWG